MKAQTMSDAIASITALHRPWYEINGVKHDHCVSVGPDDVGPDHICRTPSPGNYDVCDPEGEEHWVLACMECRGATEHGEVGYLFWPCPTVRIITAARDA